MSASVGAVNVAEFNVQLQSFAKLSKERAMDAQRKVTLQILRGVVMANPVDTGRMKGAWTASVGAPASGEGGGANLADLQFGQPSYVVNNVEYSGHVEAHHPDKAGFVAATVANVEAQFAVGVGE